MVCYDRRGTRAEDYIQHVHTDGGLAVDMDDVSLYDEESSDDKDFATMKDDAHDRERQLMRKLRVYLCNEEEGWFERAEKRRSVQERFGLQSYQLKDYVQKMKSGKDSEILSSDEFMLEEDFRYDWEELKEISVAQSGPALLYLQGRR